MLLQSFHVPPAQEPALGAFLLELFPFVEAGEDAAFVTLLARGGFTVTAAYGGQARAVASPVAVTAAYTLGGAASARCSVVAPAGWGAAAGATVACGGGNPAPAQVTALPDGRTALSFDAPLGIECLIAAPAGTRKPE